MSACSRLGTSQGWRGPTEEALAQRSRTGLHARSPLPGFPHCMRPSSPAGWSRPGWRDACWAQGLQPARRPLQQSCWRSPSSQCTWRAGARAASRDIRPAPDHERARTGLCHPARLGQLLQARGDQRLAGQSESRCRCCHYSATRNQFSCPQLCETHPSAQRVAESAGSASPGQFSPMTTGAGGGLAPVLLDVEVQGRLVDSGGAGRAWTARRPSVGLTTSGVKLDARLQVKQHPWLGMEAPAGVLRMAACLIPTGGRAAPARSTGAHFALEAIRPNRGDSFGMQRHIPIRCSWLRGAPEAGGAALGDTTGVAPAPAASSGAPASLRPPCCSGKAGSRLNQGCAHIRPNGTVGAEVEDQNLVPRPTGLVPDLHGAPAKWRSADQGLTLSVMIFSRLGGAAGADQAPAIT